MKSIILPKWKLAVLPTASQFRILVKPQPENPECYGPSPVWGQGTPCWEQEGGAIPKEKKRYSIHAAFNVNGKRVDRWLPAPYQPGEVLFVKETWACGRPALASGAGIHLRLGKPEPGDKVVYRAVSDDFIPPLPWRSATTMPVWASRYHVRIQSVRCERLQDITCGDLRAEGATYSKIGQNLRWFKDSWDSASARYPWVSNPFVFVCAYKLLDGV